MPPSGTSIGSARLVSPGVRWPSLPQAPAVRVAVVVVVALLALVNFAGIAVQVGLMLAGHPVAGHHTDFAGYQTVTRALLQGGDVFAPDSTGWIFFRWSPLAAYLLLPVVAMGVWAWRAVHLVVLLALRDWRLILITLLFWPFWADVEQGSVLTLGFVAAAVALRGSRIGGALYLGMCLLIPRPLMAPVAAWLLWRNPGWRVPFAAAALAQVAVLAAMGRLVPWVRVLAGSGSEMLSRANMGPSVLLGWWWLAIGIPLAASLAYRGRLGLASLAASPYWLLYYPVFLLLEFIRPSAARARQATGSSEAPRAPDQTAMAAERERPSTSG